MQINEDFVGSTTSQFQSVVSAAVSFFDKLITNDVSITINFQESSLNGGLAQSLTYLDGSDYNTVRAELQSHATSEKQRQAVAVLPTTDPFAAIDNGVMLLPLTEAAALGGNLPSNYTVGTVTFDPSHAWSYNNQAGAVPGQYDALGAMEHEISEILGRQLGGDGHFVPSVAALFRYSSPGQIDTSANAGGYFSIDGQNMLAPMGESGADLADWSGQVTGDACGYATAGTLGKFTQLDMSIMDALGYNIAYPVAPASGVPNVNDLSYAPSTNGSMDHYIDGLNYIASFSDLIKTFGADANKGASHHGSYGQIEGRISTFDGLDYIASSNDLIAAYRNAGSSRAIEDAGARHFIQFGYNEGRQTTFNSLDYIASFSDLISAFGTNSDAGALHYISFGYGEGRKPTFDGLGYIADNADLMSAFGANEQAGAAHFINFGFKEGRSGQAFDVTSYISAHSDLAGKYASNSAFLTDYINSFKQTGHYLT